MFNDKISIITASYNYAQYISECIESVIAQTYQNWELIIVDDGSTDNSVEIIKSYCQKDNRIKLYQHKNGQNKGLKDTILLGLKQADSEWVAFLESDDMFMPDYLEEKVKVIEKEPEVKFIFNNFDIIGNMTFKQTSYDKQFQQLMKNKIGLHNYNKEMLNDNPIPTFSVVILKKDLLLNNIDFNSPIKQWLDYYLWIQLASKNNFYFINQTLTLWRKHSDSYINTPTEPRYKFFIKLLLIGYPFMVIHKFKSTVFMFFNQLEMNIE